MATPQILDDAATQILDAATPPTPDAETPPTPDGAQDDLPDADALLAWTDVSDLMNLSAPDAWRSRQAAVLAVRRRALEEKGLNGRPPDLFAFLARESRDLQSASSRAALDALGDLLHAGPPPAEDVGAVVACLLARATNELKFIASAARRALHTLAATGDATSPDAVLAHCAAGSKARKTLAAETATRLLSAGVAATPGDARWTATLRAALQVASRDRTAAAALLRALAPATDRAAFAEASTAALGASDSAAVVALRFPAKPKRAAGEKRIPLRERMAAARGPELR